MSYMFLNAVHLHTETWEPSARQKWLAEKRKARTVVSEHEVDYRRCSLGRKLLVGARGCEASMCIPSPIEFSTGSVRRIIWAIIGILLVVGGS
jgi:hypothetical protein